MSVFTESSWEADAVGDKISRQLFLKKKKGKKEGKTKKVGPGSIRGQAKNDKPQKNIRLDDNVRKKNGKQKTKKRSLSNSVGNEETGESKAKKRRRSLSKSAAPEESSPEKSLTKSDRSGKSKGETDVSSKKLFLSKKDKAVISKKSNVDGGGKIAKSRASASSVDKETKSQRKRRNAKLKKSGQSLEANGKKFAVDGAKNENSAVKNLDVQRLEKMLAMKEKKDAARSKVHKEPESLRERMMSQLRASRFRFLNEQLYNNESSESKKYFKEDPEAFAAYHTGYRQQVEQWPLNPLDVIISSIKKMSKDLVVADFGCGEARLAESVPQKVHSFDLVAANDRVKACDMAHTPLLTNGANVVVFCLSLMGTNLADYLLEANRVLKKDGILKIADVESRFENVDEFISLLESYGFVNTWRDLSHNLFYFMDFKKSTEVSRKTKKLPVITLKPCLYKKR